MLQGVRNFLSRHRRKFLFTGAIIGGGYVALNYAQRKLLEYHERKAYEYVERTRRLQHFESTERTCNQVILGIGAELYEVILRECNTKDLIQHLKEKPANKVELWQELNIMVFTRLACFVYATSLLVIVIRVQLNLLGGYMYQDAKRNAKINDELKQEYLSLVRHYLEKGVPDLIKFLRPKVESVFKAVPLSQELHLSYMEHLFYSLQMAVNADTANDPNAHMGKYVLPAELHDAAPTMLQHMYYETLDVLETDDAISICSTNIGRGFSFIMDVLADNWIDPDTPMLDTTSDKDKNAGDIPNINELKRPLAKVIPLINTLTAQGFDNTQRPQNLATSILTFYMVMEKLRSFGANVYESFSQAQSVVS